jgi:hypothetical protein
MFSKVLLQKVSSGFIEISSCLRSVIGRVGNKDEFRSFQGAIRSPNLIAPHRKIFINVIFVLWLPSVTLTGKICKPVACASVTCFG